MTLSSSHRLWKLPRHGLSCFKKAAFDQEPIVTFLLALLLDLLGDTLHGHFLTFSVRRRAGTIPPSLPPSLPFLHRRSDSSSPSSFLSSFSRRIRLDLIGQPHSIFGGPSIAIGAALPSDDAFRTIWPESASPLQRPSEQNRE